MHSTDQGDRMRTKTNFAGRVGRWSAHHRKTAIIGWLVFVAAMYMIGGAVGTDTLDQSKAGVRDSGRAASIQADAFPQEDGENVIISSTKLDHDAPQFRAAVTDTVKRLERTKG